MIMERISHYKIIEKLGQGEMGFGGIREGKIDKWVEVVIFLNYKMNSPKSSLKKRGLNSSFTI